MGTLVPDQNYDHLLITISGWTGMHDLQKAAKFKDGEVFYRGALVSLDTNGELVAGLSSAIAMPLFAINAYNDLDVNSDVGNTAGEGIVGTMVAVGGYEIRTTEFEPTGTYAPNVQLEADAGTAGFVVSKSADWGKNGNGACVGVCVGPTNTENYNQETVGFWPVYLPEVPA